MNNEKKAIFYQLKSPVRDLCVCHFAEMYYEQGKKVFIIVDTEGRAESLDRVLWTFKQSSFIPHEIIDELSADIEVPVVISALTAKNYEADILIVAKNVLDESEAFLTSFDQVIDFADQTDESSTLQSRERYRVLKDAGFTMEYFDKLPFSIKSY